MKTFSQEFEKKLNIFLSVTLRGHGWKTFSQIRLFFFALGLTHNTQVLSRGRTYDSSVKLKKKLEFLFEIDLE